MKRPPLSGVGATAWEKLATCPHTRTAGPTTPRWQRCRRERPESQRPSIRTRSGASRASITWLGGSPVRPSEGSLVRDEAGWSFALGPAWLRDCPVGPGDRVEVTISPEGPQRSHLAPDVSAALDANPAAGESSTRSPRSTETAIYGGSRRRGAGLRCALSGSPRLSASSAQAPRSDQCSDGRSPGGAIPERRLTSMARCSYDAPWPMTRTSQIASASSWLASET